jgi:YidC/Oxa1 family membrane protein insertase
VLNFIYYPVSAIMWFWHKAFGYVFGESSGIAWALAVVFLVFTLRALLYKPFVHQVRSMRKMQEFAPEMQKLRAKYGSDKQKLAAEMQKLQSCVSSAPARPRTTSSAPARSSPSTRPASSGPSSAPG